MSEAIVNQTNGNQNESAWCVYSPDVDIYENDSELLLVADVPGASADRVTVDVHESVLTVAAEVPQSSEYKTSYRRQFRLAAAIDPDRVSAELKAGELTIRLGKADSHRPRRIDVTAA